MSTVIFAGSFDPIHLGHLDLLRRLSLQFDSVYVVVSSNKNKKYLLSKEDRVNLVVQTLAESKLQRIQVETCEGLISIWARERKLTLLARGLRGFSDFEYESRMATYNKSLNPELETLFLVSDARVAHISSSGIKEVLSKGGSLTAFLPPCAADFLSKFQT